MVGKERASQRAIDSGVVGATSTYLVQTVVLGDAVSQR
jgi:hypothetical protein